MRIALTSVIDHLILPRVNVNPFELIRELVSLSVQGSFVWKSEARQSAGFSVASAARQYFEAL